MMQLSEELTSDGEQGLLCAPGLQRLRHGLQHEARASRPTFVAGMFNFGPSGVVPDRKPAEKKRPKFPFHDSAGSVPLRVLGAGDQPPTSFLSGRKSSRTVRRPSPRFAKIGGAAPSLLLESAEQSDQVGRYSFLGSRRAPDHLRHAARPLPSSRTARPGPTRPAQDPFKELELIMARYKTARRGHPRLPHGGAVGYLRYDCVRWFEPTVPPPSKDELGVPDMFFLLAGTALGVRSPSRRRLKIVANAFIGEDGFGLRLRRRSRRN